MSIELKIPEVGESVREVQIGRWLKHEGDTVAQDENVVELETDKASMELPAPAAGVLGQILKNEGDTVAVGEVIALPRNIPQARRRGRFSGRERHVTQEKRTLNQAHHHQPPPQRNSRHETTFRNPTLLIFLLPLPPAAPP